MPVIPCSPVLPYRFPTPRKLISHLSAWSRCTTSGGLIYGKNMCNILNSQRRSQCTKGLGSGAGRRSAPHKQECTCPATLNAWSRSLWPLFRRECRGATRRSARTPMTQLDNTAPEVMIVSKLALSILVYTPNLQRK
jgi:hypothetical protein